MSFNRQHPYTTKAGFPSTGHRFTMDRYFADERPQACCFLTLSGFGAGRCCHKHIGPVHFILRRRLVMSRSDGCIEPKTVAPLRRTLAAFYAQGSRRRPSRLTHHLTFNRETRVSHIPFDQMASVDQQSPMMDDHISIHIDQQAIPQFD